MYSHRFLVYWYTTCVTFSLYSPRSILSMSSLSPHTQEESIKSRVKNQNLDNKAENTQNKWNDPNLKN